MPFIARPLRAYSSRVEGANQRLPIQAIMARRASSSVRRNGTSACGLIRRCAPVSSTTGEAQNGHSVAWVAPCISIWAPQEVQVVVRTSVRAPGIGAAVGSWSGVAGIVVSSPGTPCVGRSALPLH